MPTVVMLRTRPFHPEPRGLKEAKSLVKAGYNVHVIAWDRLCELPRKDAIENISVRRFHIPAGYNDLIKFAITLPLFWIFSLFSILRSKPEIVHCADLDTLPVGVLAKKLLGCGLVYDAYESYPDMVRDSVPGFVARFLVWLDKTLSRVADIILVVWESVFERYPGAILVPNVPEGEAFEVVSPASYASVRKQFHLEEKFVLVYIGVFMAGRGIEQVLEAVRGMDNVIFLIGGYGQEEETIRKLSEDVRESRVIGFVPPEKIPGIVSACDAVVELLDPQNINYGLGISNKVFEAMNAGIPIIVSKGTTAEKFVAEVGCGVAVEYGNIDELRDVIRRFVSDRDFARSIGAKGKNAARERWRWEVMEKEFIKKYDELKNKAIGKRVS